MIFLTRDMLYGMMVIVTIASCLYPLFLIKAVKESIEGKDARVNILLTCLIHWATVIVLIMFPWCY